jgi:hypothetical protein
MLSDTSEIISGFSGRSAESATGAGIAVPSNVPVMAIAKTSFREAHTGMRIPQINFTINYNIALFEQPWREPSHRRKTRVRSLPRFRTCHKRAVLRGHCR